MRRERLAAIRQRVQALPERQRIAVIMHKYQQMDYRQIAEVLKLSESAIKSSVVPRVRNIARATERVCMKGVVMKCNEICELMPDLAAGLAAVTPEVNQHLESCAGCAAKLNEFRQTMALLDEWQAPEPSPYFDVRLQRASARGGSTAAAGWWQWIRKPALAVSLAVLMVMSVTLFRTDAGRNPTAEGPRAMDG